MLEAQVQALAAIADGNLGDKVEGVVTFNGKPTVASLTEKLLAPNIASKFTLLYLNVEVGSVTLVKDGAAEPWKFKKVA